MLPNPSLRPVVPQTGHRARFGGDFKTGGAEIGTPGTLGPAEVRRGAIQREKKNGQTLGPVRNKYIKVFGQ